MSRLFSIVTPRVCQSIEETKLKRPPNARQRFLDFDLLVTRELTFEWFCAKTERPRLKHHPPQRRSTTIHPGVMHIPASSTCKAMTNSNLRWTGKCTYISECVPANQTSRVCGCFTLTLFMPCVRSTLSLGDIFLVVSPSSLVDGLLPISEILCSTLRIFSSSGFAHVAEPP